ncbi:uncharacterized protein DUF1648 [Ureibacillus xyleni]|uniref:Uncharacterized protein DUF1648 n=1 Tax=Ureibacillus xyleni TaxID=614648 RepID=A0A285SBW2_9BACL|nr:DUF1648 domain-containing protein [Ureibacillus xyleni]SOC05183.1 uncharacterized protein DUF1648 [Ureibacillus xyleni]
MNGKLPYRPIVHIPKTKIEKMTDIICFGLFVLSLVYVVFNWGKIPDEIPGHFNATGEVDRWGSKYELFILPIIGTLQFILMSLLEKAPHMHNYPKRINASNVEQFYLQSRKLLNVIKNISLLMFGFLIVQIVRVTKGDIQTLGAWFMPILIGIIFIVVVIGIFQQKKIK